MAYIAGVEHLKHNNMKAQELRIGNYVLANQAVKVNEIKQMFNDDPYTIVLEDDGGMFFDMEVEHVKPIPITEEWLERLGAVEKDVAGLRSEWVHVTEFLEFNWSEDSGLIVFIVGSQDSISMKHIDSVHLYQNLYHALTGEELTLKQ